MTVCHEQSKVTWIMVPFTVIFATACPCCPGSTTIAGMPACFRPRATYPFPPPISKTAPGGAFLVLDAVPADAFTPEDFGDDRLAIKAAADEFVASLLPETDGMPTLQRCRAEARGKDVRAVMLTADIRLVTLERSLH